jgi:RNA polymerase sigma-70 factor (ECF subfamily)
VNAYFSRLPIVADEIDASRLALLVGVAQSGHAPSLDALLRWVQLPLYRHILSLTTDQALAEDVMQSALWAIARKIGQLREPQLFKAWAYRIATRFAIRATRQERAWSKALRDESLSMIPDEDDDARVAAGVDTGEIEKVVASLSDASAIVVRMHYIDQLTYLEIAEALGIPLGTVKSRIAYGLATLRRRLAGSDVLT